MIAIMAVALGGLSTPTVFDTIGEPETLEPRWEEFKDEMETYLEASGVVQANQKKSLLLHVGGKGLKKIYLMKTPDERKATEDSDVYQVALDIFNNHYRLKKNVPKARLAFMDIIPIAIGGETVNNFITRLQVQAKYCEFGDQTDNQVRDKVLFHIKDVNLKAKLLRDDNLTLTRVIEVISTYHDKRAMVFHPTDNTNRVHGGKPPYKGSSNRNTGKCYGCGAAGHYKSECRRSKDCICEICGKTGHFAKCCRELRSERRPGTVKEEPTYQGQRKPRQPYRGSGSSRGRGRGHTQRSVEEHSEDDNINRTGEFYLFKMGSTDIFKLTRYEDVIELTMNDAETIPLVVNSGAHHNTMSEDNFKRVARASPVELKPTSTKLYAYASQQPLELLGQCDLKIGVPNTGRSVSARFFVIPNTEVSLLSNKTSKDLGVLKVGLDAVFQCTDGDV